MMKVILIKEKKMTERKRKLKVFGTGAAFYGRRQIRIVVAASSRKKVAEITGHTLNFIKTHWSETGNIAEVEAAMSKPGTVFYEVPSPRGKTNSWRTGIYKPIPYDEEDF
jgi:hypothetical protein